MGSDLSQPQRVSVSDNGRWLHMEDAEAYVNVRTVAFFRVNRTGWDAPYISFHLLDHKSGTDGETYNVVRTKTLTSSQIAELLDALTQD